MRKKVLTLKQAKPAIVSMIQHMKKKYAGRDIQFLQISTIPDDQLNKMMPRKVLNYLNSVQTKRMTGHIGGVEFYYYKLLVNNQGLFISPIILFYIGRDGNLGNKGNRVLACSLEAYLPKTETDDTESGDL